MNLAGDQLPAGIGMVTPALHYLSSKTNNVIDSIISMSQINRLVNLQKFEVMAEKELYLKYEKPIHPLHFEG